MKHWTEMSLEEILWTLYTTDKKVCEWCGGLGYRDIVRTVWNPSRQSPEVVVDQYACDACRATGTAESALRLRD